MFELSLFEHLRLTFGHIVYRQKAHSQIAHSRATWSRILRGTEALLMVGVVLTSVAAASGRGPAFVIAGAVLAGLSLIVLLCHLTFDLDASARVHALCAARLWKIREQYRAVLSDFCDGAIDAAMARQRRDALTAELHDFLEHAPPVPPQAYRPADQMSAADEPALTDEQIDLFLPKSLHKAARAATT